MSDYGGAISLSHGRDLSSAANNNNSDDSDSDHMNKSAKLAIAEVECPSSSGKKPRGRPRGSKNKPKPPIVITRDGDGGMRPVVLEVAPGADVVDEVVGYARRNRVGISLLSGTGSVSNITLRHPMTHAPTLSLHGTYNLLCLCGSYLASAAKPNSSASSAATFGLTVAGQQGQVFGGIVAGNVTAATAVVVVAATYVNPAYHRLPATDAGEEDDGGAGEEQPPLVAAYGVAAPTPLSCQMSPDVMSWGPTSRPPY